MSEKQYWKGIEEVSPQSITVNKANEFSDKLPLEEAFDNDELVSSRRDFLKFFGFSIGAVSLAACNKTPIKYAVPYLDKPDNVTPGNPLYYASTCGGCNAGCGTVVKVREGRPIKVDGNKKSSISQGGLCAAGQASIMSLYDINRLANPLLKGGEQENWTKIDADIIGLLKKVQNEGKRLAIIQKSNNSPSINKALQIFKSAYPNTDVITYDDLSYSGILKANEKSFGKRVIPKYNFDKADVIVSFEADFLGTWISPTEFTKGYSANRVPSKDGKMSMHLQFESNMSLTGANSDQRITIQNANLGIHLATLYNKIAAQLGQSSIAVAKELETAGNTINKAAKELVAAKGHSLVVCGSNDVHHQILTNAINSMLSNYGSTIDIQNHRNFSDYDETKFEEFIANSSQYGAVILHGNNPIYSYSNPEKLKTAFSKLTLISTATDMNETAELAYAVCPDHHYLESWGDTEAIKGEISFTQPTIANVFNTRQYLESLLIWSEYQSISIENNSLAYSFVKKHWLENGVADFNKVLHDGVHNTSSETPSNTAFNITLEETVNSINNSKKSSGFELKLTNKVGMLAGQESNNPWIQELPDPVTKVTWDNYVAISKVDADEMEIKDGHYVTIKVNGKVLEKVPALIQPGQARKTASMHLGYGRVKVGKVGIEAGGKNAAILSSIQNGITSYDIKDVIIEKSSGIYEFARTQTHQLIEGRDIIREATASEYAENPYVKNENHPHIYSLWDEYSYKNKHKWAMAIDLNKCTGCSACIVSCSIENNVPVVGKTEVRRRREMHWIRIDRYYAIETSTQEKVTEEREIAEMSNEELGNWENVSTVHMPMLCQHCDHAPCETVCPVLATTHSSEGLNQMTYNRCIGTKYCGNNCPYKVRRFNWFRYNDNNSFDYHFNNDLGKMVINPDVTVRTRGVMEKCSFCVQKIQDAKLTAKREGRKLKDGEFTTACAKSCPADAIVFGDVNDPKSEISKAYKDERSYVVLEEINVKPSIVYKTKIRNIENEKKLNSHHNQHA